MKDDQLNIRASVKRAFQSKDYILHPGLKNAVEVALALDQPLLLTGEPGTGKTKLAFKIADMLSKQDERFSSSPLIFNTKTTSNARDLFYTYDALAHFQAANIKDSATSKPKGTADYIDLQALGKAIAQTNPGQVKQDKDAAKKYFKTVLEANAKSAVVLVDEIDKAPRDFSNDILNEIENFEFNISEQNNLPIKKGDTQQILVIMTSNSEKNLPDAFLRRCVFYHIPFPDRDMLLKIAKAQLGEVDMDKYKFTDMALKSIIDQFETIRKVSTRKKPATAELVSWIRILGIHRFMEKGAKAQKELMLQNLSILVKTQEDLHAVTDLLEEAIKNEID